MPADRLLGTLLRAFQTWSDQQDTPRLLGTGVSLLTTLNNPLNVTLLTSQLLSAPAIWAHPEGLQTSVRCLSVFHSAAQTLIRHEAALSSKTPDKEFENLQLEHALPKGAWIEAVTLGADHRSPQWRHLLVFGGLLLGFGPSENIALATQSRLALENALVDAVHRSITNDEAIERLGSATITFVLNHCFPLLSDRARSRLNYDLLLPLLVQTTLYSSDGLRSSYFLGAINMDLKTIEDSRLNWSEATNSYQQVLAISSSPIAGSLGPLARLIGHVLENVRDANLVVSTSDNIEDFARTLLSQWSQSRLSDIDASEEHLFLDQETRDKTSATLWKLLRAILFSTVIMMRSILGRAFGDAALARDEVATRLAKNTLQTLRSLYFISTRMGSSNFSQYTFVNLTAIDILATHPESAELSLQSIRPAELGHIPSRPLERCLDLFFLNTAEHFTSILSPQSSEQLLVAAAAPYLAAGGNNNLLPIFEAAHSVMLATFSPPHNTALATKHLPFYVDALFTVFPQNLSARQFRLAYKALIRLTSAPSALSQTNPLLAATLLELVHERARNASTAPLPPSPHGTSTEESLENVVLLSEQAVLTLAVLDTLSQLSADLLYEWLPLAADMIHTIADATMREHCKQRFWHILVDGELDPDRSGICHAWWSTCGGREHVLFGRPIEDEIPHEMSGALQEEVSSKL